MIIHWRPSTDVNSIYKISAPSLINYTSLERKIQVYLKDLAISGRTFKGNADLLSIIQEALDVDEAKRLKLAQNTDTDLLLSVLYNGDINKKYTNKYKGNEDILSSLIELFDEEKALLFKKKDSDFEELIMIIEHSKHAKEVLDRKTECDLEDLLMVIPIPELINYVLDVDAFSSYIIDLEVYNEPQNYVLDLEVI